MPIGYPPFAVATAPPPSAGPPEPSSLQPFGEDGLTFRDLLDIVNPLHHVPLLGNVYRRVTGDVIDPAIRIAGGALFGGPIGAGFAAVSVALANVMRGGDSTADPQTAPARDATPTRTAPPPERHAVTQTPRRNAAPRGGWMVAAARPVRFDDASPALAERDAPPTGIAPRRGGWLAQAGYAMADERAARETRIDLTA